MYFQFAKHGRSRCPAAGPLLFSAGLHAIRQNMKHAISTVFAMLVYIYLFTQHILASCSALCHLARSSCMLIPQQSCLLKSCHKKCTKQGSSMRVCKQFYSSEGFHCLHHRACRHCLRSDLISFFRREAAFHCRQCISQARKCIVNRVACHERCWDLLGLEL